MLFRRLIFYFCLLLVGLNVNLTAAQTLVACAERGELIKSLEDRYSEKPYSRGVSGIGTVLELLKSDDRSFTLLMTYPNGMSCIIATGNNWEKQPVSRNARYFPSF